MPVKEKHRAADDDTGTRERLLEVAGETFGESGFRQTTIREICKRAGMNVASVHYYFGSKEQLYLAALRGALEQAKHGPPPRPDLPLDKADLPRFLRFFVKNAVERILAPRPDWHLKLIQRELVEPSFALETVVKEYMRPNFRYLRDGIAAILPGATARELDLHALSIMGQIVYYRCAGPVALRLLGEKGFEAALCDEIAEHVTRFSARALGVRA